MINTLKEAFDSYFNILQMIGNISLKETKVFMIVSFLKKYVYTPVTELSYDDLKKVEEILNCLIQQSCIISDLPQLVPASSANNSGSMVTQSGVTIISNNGHNLATQTNDEVQRFSDFSYQASLGNEDFLAGYDSTLNKNIRVNAGSIVLAWQPI